MTGGATFSADRRYRYRLWRRWDRSRPLVAFVMLNPSTADASRDDPTIRRCIGFARRWGFGGVEVVNLFAFRARDPRALRRRRDPVGPRNDRHIAAAAGRTEFTVAAWGTFGRTGRTERVLALLGDKEIRHLGLTRSGQPTHPLYLRATRRARHWRGIGVGKRSLPRV